MDGSSSCRVWEEVLPKIISELKLDYDKKKPNKYFIRCTSSDTIWSSKVVDDLNSKQWFGRLFSLRKTNPGCFIFYSEQHLEEGEFEINGNNYKLNLFKIFRKKSKKSQQNSENNSEKIQEKKLISKAFVFGIPQTRETFDSVVNKIGQVEEVIFPDINKSHTPRAIISFSNIFFPEILDQERISFTHTKDFPSMSIVWFNFVKDNKEKFKLFYSNLNKTDEQKFNEIAQKCLQIAQQKQKERTNEIQSSEEQEETSEETTEGENNLFKEDKNSNKNKLFTKLEESSDSDEDTKMEDAIKSLDQIDLYPTDIHLNIGGKRERRKISTSPNSPPKKITSTAVTPPITPPSTNTTTKKNAEVKGVQKNVATITNAKQKTTQPAKKTLLGKNETKKIVPTSTNKLQQKPNSPSTKSNTSTTRTPPARGAHPK